MPFFGGGVDLKEKLRQPKFTEVTFAALYFIVYEIWLASVAQQHPVALWCPYSRDVAAHLRPRPHLSILRVRILQERGFYSCPKSVT
jgi:hypothetical protein